MVLRSLGISDEFFYSTELEWWGADYSLFYQEKQSRCIVESEGELSQFAVS
jgi:hypothetical protein